MFFRRSVATASCTKEAKLNPLLINEDRWRSEVGSEACDDGMR